MDKQKQIEEMAEVLCESKDHICNGEDCKCIKQAVDLYNAGYRKIPKGAVVLTDKKDIQQYEWSKMCDKMGIFELIEKKYVEARKETAEKFAEMLIKEADKNRDNLGNRVVFICDIENVCGEIVKGK